MSEETPKKPLPSAAEINAYLELSAARTKKRLPLAFNKPAPKLAAVERKLRLTGASAPQVPVTGSTARDDSAEPGWAPSENTADKADK